MKKILFLPAAILLLNLVSSCSSCKQEPGDEDDTIKVGDSIKIEEAPDSTLWGHLGESTGMSVIEFVTEKGDTIYVRRGSDDMEAAGMMGTIRNYTDRFAITVSADEEEPYLTSCVNTSELMGVWKNRTYKLSLYADGTADNEQAHYTAWRVINGRLVLTGSTSTEYGETARIDTMTITYLDEDSLKLITPLHEEINLGRN